MMKKKNVVKRMEKKVNIKIVVKNKSKDFQQIF